MLYEKDYCTAAPQIILASSTDGIQFTDVKTIVPPNYLNNPRNQNVNLFFNPNNASTTYIGIRAMTPTYSPHVAQRQFACRS